ncbi:MAG: hypothetical protein ACK5PG_13680 [Lysobacterales bacterium]|jgi:hypothetical protein
MTVPQLALLSLLLAFGGAAAAQPITAREPAPLAPPDSAPASPAPRKSPVLCPIPKTGSEGSFYVVAAPDVVCPKSIAVNEPIYAILECMTGPHSATCEAWPRVYAVNPGDEDRLQYTWTVRVGWSTTHYPISSNPTISFPCPGIQPVSVTVRVSNGTASDLDMTGFRCGDDPR